MSEKDKCIDEDNTPDVEWRACVIRQLTQGEERMSKIESSMATIDMNTRELIEAFNAVKGGFKVLQVIGSIAKWGSAILVFGAAIVSIFQGKWPGR